MKISGRRPSEIELIGIFFEAQRLLCNGNLGELVACFGYALALGRDPEGALRLDLSACLAEIGGVVLRPNQAEPLVSYFPPNETGLFALVQGIVDSDDGSLLLELAVSESEGSSHIILEDISVNV